jgi:hypothetical protein
MSNNANFWIKIEKKNKIKINNNNTNNHNNHHEENYNRKKILCNSYLKGEECQYKEKCLYAHSIDEQKMELIRKKVYNIIQNEFDLSYLDLGTKSDEESNELIKNLTVMTKVCQDCLNKKCAGGVNCKFGVYNSNLQICYEDMYTGKCTNENCQKVHLTKRGFTPINKNNEKPKKKKYTGVYIPKPIEVNEEFFLSENFKSLLNESDINVDDISSVESSLDESIFN